MNTQRTPSGRFVIRVLLLTLMAVVATLVLPQHQAEACGGFFCDNNQPVNQAAERIIFSDDGEGNVTAVVQILYEGPAEQFSWILPVPGSPGVGVSSNIAFQRLQNTTNPAYTLQTVVEGECNDDQFGRGTSVNDSVQNADAGSSDVTVVASGSVGPYDYDVIAVDDEADDPAQAALLWLESNGYDVTETGPDLLRPYLVNRMNLIGFRLTKGASAGEIRPVILSYQADCSMIPIRLTAVAANADMGVMVWVLGSDRAVPTNYRDLVLNEALINWFNPNSNYNDVVIAAADEAGGQGFVTEFAGSTDGFDQVVISEWERDTAESIETTDWTGRHTELLETALNTFSGWDGIEETVEATVPLPSDVSTEDFLMCISCYLEGDTLETFDPSAFVSAFLEDVIDPAIETQDLLDGSPYVTRMYSTLSASEMTLDPVFEFNPELDDVSNQHTATRTIYCNRDVSQTDAPWGAELPGIGLVRGVGQSWPFDLSSDQPRNRQVQQLSTSGAGTVVTDNTRTIEQALAANNDAFIDDSAAGDESSCGCGVASEGGLGGFILMSLLGIALIGRKRERN